MSRNVISGSRSEAGFSIVEILVVVVILFILTSISVFYLFAYQRTYKPDDQAMQIVDLLQEARQRSLTQRKVMRVEINRDTNMVTLIDERDAGTTDDIVIRKVPLMNPNDVKVGFLPPQISTVPEESVPVPTISFTPSTYPTSVGQSVATLCFRPFGGESGAAAVVDSAGLNPLSVTIPIWAPTQDNPNRYEIARAITVIAATGSVRLWAYDPASSATNKWVNSKRGGTY